MAGEGFGNWVILMEPKWPSNFIIIWDWGSIELYEQIRFCPSQLEEGIIFIETLLRCLAKNTNIKRFQLRARRFSRCVYKELLEITESWTWSAVVRNQTQIKFAFNQPSCHYWIIVDNLCTLPLRRCSPPTVIEMIFFDSIPSPWCGIPSSKLHPAVI